MRQEFSNFRPSSSVYILDLCYVMNANVTDSTNYILNNLQTKLQVKLVIGSPSVYPTTSTYRRKVTSSACGAFSCCQ